MNLLIKTYDFLRSCLDNNEFRKADAVYYWALCFESSGAERSYYLKYGEIESFKNSIIEFKKFIGFNQACEYIYNCVIECFEKLPLQYFINDVLNRVKRLSKEALEFAKYIKKMDFINSLKIEGIPILYISSTINQLAKLRTKFSHLFRKIIFELIGSGLLIACCWAPYEGLSHVYLIPKYSEFVWKFYI